MMLYQDAYLFLQRMFEPVEAVTGEVVELALDRARTIDDEGRPPTDPTWAATVNEWWAAAEVAEAMFIAGALLPAQKITQFTSEGATFHLSGAAPDWQAVASIYRDRAAADQPTGWAMVALPDQAADFHPRSEEDPASWF